MTIPASAIVNVTPSVLAAAGAAVALNGLLLTQGARVPIGTVQTFASAAAVIAYFGAGSTEAQYAAVYFAGFDNSTQKPSALLIAQYPPAAVPAFLRGSSLSSMTLAQLQAISGTLTVTVDGQAFTAGSLNLSAASSFSNAATLIQTALAAKDAVVTAAIATTVMTVSAVTSGALAVGQVISGTGVTAGTTITSFGTGTGGTGTYNVSVSQTVTSTAITAGAAAVTFDSTTNAFQITGGTPGAAGSISVATGTVADVLGLSAAKGAVTSPGAAAATPAAAMTTLSGITQNWGFFTTAWEPPTADGLAFALWTSGQNSRYGFVAWDTDANVAAGNAPASLGAGIKAAAYSGTILVWSPSEQYLAPFVLGIAGSLDFTRTAGRQTFKFRAQAGLTPGVTDPTTAGNVEANGYNYYASYGNAVGGWNFLTPGVISGPFAWADSYANQIWLNSALQSSMLTLLTSAGQIPYNKAGYQLIYAAALDPINAALNFGAMQPGVTLSASQAAQVNGQAGRAIDGTLSQAGWYLLIKDASPSTRVARGSPPITLFYMDGESVQTINIASIELQ